MLALAEAPTAQNLWLTEEVSASFATHSRGSYHVSTREDGLTPEDVCMFSGRLSLFGGFKIWRFAWFGDLQNTALQIPNW